MEALSSGTRYSQALADCEVTSQAVTSRRRINTDFAAALDLALDAGRDPALPHGKSTAWKQGCRCTDCRGYHEQTR